MFVVRPITVSISYDYIPLDSGDATDDTSVLPAVASILRDRDDYRYLLFGDVAVCSDRVVVSGTHSEVVIKKDDLCVVRTMDPVDLICDMSNKLDYLWPICYYDTGLVLNMLFNVYGSQLFDYYELEEEVEEAVRSIVTAYLIEANVNINLSYEEDIFVSLDKILDSIEHNYRKKYSVNVKERIISIIDKLSSIVKEPVFE